MSTARGLKLVGRKGRELLMNEVIERPKERQRCRCSDCGRFVACDDACVCGSGMRWLCEDCIDAGVSMDEHSWEDIKL